MRRKLKHFLTIPDLPAGFTELEYLESSGTQWINPEAFALGSSIEVHAELIATGAFVGAEHITGGWVLQLSSGTNNIGFGVAWAVGYYDGGHIVLYPGVNGVMPGSGISARLDYKSMVAEVNEVSKNIENYYPPNMPAGAPLYMFCTASYNPSSGDITAKRFLIGKIRNLKIWQQLGKAFRDFVPVLDANGTPCMFDKISRKSFYNNGTGTFGYKVKSTGRVVAPQ